MPTKSKSTKTRTKIRDIPQKPKTLSKGDQKKVKGGSTSADETTAYKTVVIAMRKSGGDPNTSGKEFSS